MSQQGMASTAKAAEGSTSKHPPLALLGAALLHHNELSAEDAFNTVDQNGAGFILLADFETVFGELDLGCTPPAIQEAFALVDANRCVPSGFSWWGASKSSRRTRCCRDVERGSDCRAREWSCGPCDVPHCTLDTTSDVYSAPRAQSAWRRVCAATSGTCRAATHIAAVFC